MCYYQLLEKVVELMIKWTTSVRTSEISRGALLQWDVISDDEMPEGVLVQLRSSQRAAIREAVKARGSTF